MADNAGTFVASALGILFGEHVFLGCYEDGQSKGGEAVSGDDLGLGKAWVSAQVVAQNL